MLYSKVSVLNSIPQWSHNVWKPLICLLRGLGVGLDFLNDRQNDFFCITQKNLLLGFFLFCFVFLFFFFQKKWKVCCNVKILRQILTSDDKPHSLLSPTGQLNPSFLISQLYFFSKCKWLESHSQRCLWKHVLNQTH